MAQGLGAEAGTFVIAVGGRVASGKSHVARCLAERLSAAHVEADRIRDELEKDGPEPPAERHEARWLRSFGPLFATQVYAELVRRAARALAESGGVVVDACFPRAAQRERVRSLARRFGARFLFVECEVDAATLERRLAERDAASERAGWSAIAAALGRDWEPVTELPELEHLRLDTSGALELGVSRVLERIASRRPSDLLAADATAERPDAVTFDCWSTLLFEPSWPLAHERRVEALVTAAREAGREVSAEHAGRAFDAAWERHMRLWSEGVCSGAREVAVWALAELGLRDPHPALEHLTQRFEEASHSGRVEALPGAGDTLEALARRGVRRALVCDTGLTPGRVVRRHLARLGLLELLEVQSFSDEVGVPKPDPRAFLAALDPLRVAPRRALHVGDLRRTDVAGARGLGMATARIRERHDDVSALPEADYVVSSHAELRSLLDRLHERATAPR